MSITIGEALVLMGVPSAVTGLAVWLLKVWLQKKQDKDDERERARTEISVAMVAAINAALTLGEATANAVSRIPDAHCNGDMHEALEYARQVKQAQKDLLFRAGLQSLNND